jgi:hypothetical protein
MRMKNGAEGLWGDGWVSFFGKWIFFNFFFFEKRSIKGSQRGRKKKKKKNDVMQSYSSSIEKQKTKTNKQTKNKNPSSLKRHPDDRLRAEVLDAEERERGLARLEADHPLARAEPPRHVGRDVGVEADDNVVVRVNPHEVLERGQLGVQRGPHGAAKARRTAEQLVQRHGGVRHPGHPKHGRERVLEDLGVVAPTRGARPVV